MSSLNGENLRVERIKKVDLARSVVRLLSHSQLPAVPVGSSFWKLLGFPEGQGLPNWLGIAECHLDRKTYAQW